MQPKFTDNARVGTGTERRRLRRHARGQGSRLLDPSCELEVLKCIMLREGYLKRVARLADEIQRGVRRGHSPRNILPAGMVDLLDLLRQASIDTVEAISMWRLSQVTKTPAPFIWNGLNYLEKMIQDCNFLDRIEALRRWLGFRIVGNPFFLPCGEAIRGSGRVSRRRHDERPDIGNLDLKFDDSDLADVGTQPWLGPLIITEGNTDIEAAKEGHDKLRQRRGGNGSDVLAPYRSPVINEPTLIPTCARPPYSRGLDSSPSKTPAKIEDGLSHEDVHVNVERIVPNVVSREDARRISTAIQVLADEEARCSAVAAPTLRKAVACHSTTQELDVSTEQQKTQAPIPCGLVVEQRGSDKLRSTSRASAIEKLSFDSANAQQRITRTDNTICPLVRTVGDLVDRPLPKPHPGLGAILLRSDIAGRQSHAHPFVYTVDKDLALGSRHFELDVCAGTPPEEMEAGLELERTSSTRPRTSMREREIYHRHDVAQGRAATAPARTVRVSCRGGLESACSASRVRKRLRHRLSSTQRDGMASHASSTSASRKAGAELTALTAAGTSGRRQPPPREARLRRLARDVVRQTAELRDLVREEKKLRQLYQRCRKSDPPGVPEERMSNSPVVTAWTQQTNQSEEKDIAQAHDCNLECDAGTSGDPGQAMEIVLLSKQEEIDFKSQDLGVKRDELRSLKMVQKQLVDRKRALELERARRSLGEGQILRDDEAVAEALEQNSALLLQKRVRGNHGRAYASWYRNSVNQAATVIQRGVRFIWDRRATRWGLLQQASARPMQATARMFVQRKQYLQQRKTTGEQLACRKLQKMVRGMRGRRRAAARRIMLTAASAALRWVSLEALQPKHLLELARAIQAALLDPLRQLPPAGVLGAIRVVSSILEDAGDRKDPTSFEHGPCGDMVTFQTAFGRSVRAEVSAPHLTWEMAARVVGRPFRLLRRMRAFASGLGAHADPTPVRILHISPQAMKLLDAYRNDPSWSSAALESISEGRTAALSLIGWARQLGRVYLEQPKLEEFLRDAQPSWLRESRSLQRRRRSLLLSVESIRQAVLVARDHRLALQARERAYGDPVTALKLLEKRQQHVEAEIAAFETKHVEFLAAQAHVEAATGRMLRDRVEFADREVSVLERAHTTALRLGECDANELEDLTCRIRDRAVIVRELRRQLAAWDWRCQEEKVPLLRECVPPTEQQLFMARALGSAQAWQEIALVQKRRLEDEAGGRRFLKGLKGDDKERWRSVCEGLQASREDVLSCRLRLKANICDFEIEIAKANNSTAAKKVSSAPWDNASPATEALEREEDHDAARDERESAMGATFPAKMFRDMADPHRKGCRPTLLLFGLDVPAAVRATVRARLDRDAPGIFGLHLCGDDALPSLVAAEAQANDRSFLNTCGHLGVEMRTYCPGHGEGSRKAHPKKNVASDARRVDAQHASFGPAEKSRVSRLHETLSAGKSVSLDVAAGPGLWTSGQFLRDLEALLRGLDTCADGLRNDGRYRGVPTVVLVDGHHANRCGSGADKRHGIERPAVVSEASTPRQIKMLLEEAAQCLHELGTTHGTTRTPFEALSSTRTLHDSSNVDDARIRDDGDFADDILSRSESGDCTLREDDCAERKAAERVYLLAVCHLLLHHEHQHDLGERQEADRRQANDTSHMPAAEVARQEEDKSRANFGISTAVLRQAESCRQELRQQDSALGVAHLLGKTNLLSFPVSTVVAVRRLRYNPAWPSSSPHDQFVACAASQALAGWIVATSSAVVKLLSTGGSISSNIFGPSESLQREAPCRHIRPERQAITSPAAEDGGLNWPSSPLMLGGIATGRWVREGRLPERGMLEEVAAALVDETIIVLDDDSPWWIEAGTGAQDRLGRRRHRRRASAVFDAIMDTILRPYVVYDEGGRVLKVESRMPATPMRFSPISPEAHPAPAFHVTFSRAFGSIYARVKSSAHGGKSSVEAMARIREEDLSRILCANWMETHDLSTVRDLRTELAIWRALADTLVVQYPRNDVDHTASGQKHAPRTARSGTRSLSEDGTIAPSRMFTSTPFSASPSADGASAVSRHTDGAASTGLLYFRHSRRLTLSTSCWLMGSMVPVSVFEESRGDFWCEALAPSVPSQKGSKFRSVCTRIPKESISWLLHEGHPMRMQSMLNAADLRELSALIADRLKLRHVGGRADSSPTYRHWLHESARSDTKSENDDSQRGVEIEDVMRLRLVLRKRALGQVRFSRMVSFWYAPVSTSEDLACTCAIDVGTCDVAGDEDAGGCGAIRREEPCIQLLVTVKQIAHRGKYGELKVEVYDPRSGERLRTPPLAPHLTKRLLAETRRDTQAKNSETRSDTRHWRDTIMWRIYLMSARDSLPKCLVENRARRPSRRAAQCDGATPSDARRILSDYVVEVDDRVPLLYLAGVLATKQTSTRSDVVNAWPLLIPEDSTFDIRLLPLKETSQALEQSRRSLNLDLVVTHLQTANVYRFCISPATLVEGVDRIVASCLAAPTSLSTDLLAPASNDLRQLVRIWPSSCQQDGDAFRAMLTICTPGTDPRSSSPVVGLRFAKRTGVCKRDCGRRSRRVMECNNGGGAGRARCQRRRVPTTVGSGGVACVSARDSGETALLVRECLAEDRDEDERRMPSTVRNERMIFRRTLAFSRLLLSNEANDKCQTLTVARPGADVHERILISIYEVFPTGTDGRVGRHLSFVARDERCRPATEAAAEVEWTESCDMTEGGALWCFATENLVICRTCDDRGECAALRLSVLSPKCLREQPSAGEASTGSQSPQTSARRRSWEGIARDTGSRATAEEESDVVRGGVYFKDAIDRRHEETAITRAEERGTSSMSCEIASGQRIGRHCPPANATPKTTRELAIYTSWGSCSTKVYDGWHCITGLRLHVQCFQEQGHPDNTSAHVFSCEGISKSEARTPPAIEDLQRPASRGGVVALPENSYLRFLTCDPGSGRRASAVISVEDLRCNSSTSGGIVDEDLLSAGRRPALARAIADKLRLLFDSDDGYALMVPPLPKFVARSSVES